MEPVLKQSMSASKLANIDVSQLDKINAFPNKNSDSALMDGLCHEDRLYLNALMDEDSNSDEDNNQARRGSSSAWSPMVQKPVLMNKRKRLRKMRSSYAITLSLEDISYIRPSWGISKGIKRIEVNKNKNKKKGKSNLRLSDATSNKASTTDDKSENDMQASKNAKKKQPTNLAYYAFLVGLAVAVTTLIVSSRSIELYRFDRKLQRDRIQLDSTGRKLKIYKPVASSQHKSSPLELLLNVNLAQGIPVDLKYKECSCDNFNEAFDEYTKSNLHDNKDIGLLEMNKKRRSEYGDCFACLDWAERANLRIHLTTSGEDDSYCYSVKWQSYDTLASPLIDCFEFEHEQWFGLGDLQSPISWPLNKLQFQASKLVTNLTGEFQVAGPRGRVPLESSVGAQREQQQQSSNKTSLQFGSFVEFSLINSAGIHLTNLRSDFQTSIRMNNNPKNGATQLCLSTQCADKCGSTWAGARVDKLKQFKYENNILHYSICTDTNWRDLVARSFSTDKATASSTRRLGINIKGIKNGTAARLTEREDSKHRGQLNELVDTVGESKTTNNVNYMTRKSAPEKIGLIERTIFKTSLEFMQTLDGQTMREFVDQIVKLNLKTSPILIIDTRWQTYVGSFKLNSALFPKAKLLFEILHNKGFKIVLTIKPYIDTAIGINNINQLMELDRLVTTSRSIQSPASAAADLEPTVLDNRKIVDSDESALEPSESDDYPKKYYLIRRKSFFSFRNETILLEQDLRSSTKGPTTERLPLSFRCRESRDGYCVLVDLTQERNRIWLIDAIKRSSFLTQEADAILVAGAHPNGFLWDDDYRLGLSKLVDSLFYDEQLFALPQWTGNFKYIQLAPRQRTWGGLKSIVNSILNLGLTGWSLVHPGSVWGDLKEQDDSGLRIAMPQSQLATSGASNNSQFSGDQQTVTMTATEEESQEELVIRWLQVAIFLPIFQMNDLKPIEKYGLNQQLQNLIKIRKLHIVPELKKNLPPTQLVSSSGANSKPISVSAGADQLYESNKQLPLIRPVWIGLDSSETIVGEQFQIGSDVIVAPVLNEGQRQKDIYLPFGFWRDELRQTNIRGGKWLRNYPIELNEIVWFTRARR